MIFKEIRINNLFSYYGEQVFTFKACEEHKHLVLISGRNGFGKTSFIESVKLLFLGVSKKMLENVQRGRRLSTSAYILGHGDEWSGIMNKRARAEGKRDFSVSIVWEEGDDDTVEATRSWRLSNNGTFTEELSVSPTFGKPLDDKEQAQEFLSYRLPEEFVSFFFYDGEQITELAEANRDELLEQIEKLFGLFRIDNLLTYIDKNRKSWEREDSPNVVSHQLKALEAALAEQEAKVALGAEQKQRVEADIARLERQQADDENYLMSKRSYAQGDMAEKLQNRLKETSARLQKEQYDLAQRLPKTAPFLCNPALAEKAIKLLREHLEDEDTNLVASMKSILEDLPRDLFEKGVPSSPPLTASQCDFYTNKLKKLIAPYIDEAPSESKFFSSLDKPRTLALERLLLRGAQDDENRSQLAAGLTSISSGKQAINKLDGEINEVSNLAEDERKRYNAKKEAHEQRKKQIDAKKSALNDTENAIKADEKECRDIQKRIAEQSNKLILAEGNRHRVDLSGRLSDLFEEMKLRLKQQKRESVENALNRHFFKLMSSHNQIKKINVAGDFGIQYTGQDDASVGMAGLSAGMKQIAATALLWSLKEVSGKSVPVIIDTPLARFDREHQENLLRHYYPNAGEQVIILPTDSELDREKYEILKPHILQEFVLSNPGGERSTVTERSMY